ncbi:MAG: paraquat-inducible protein B [Lentimonas sp.]
MSRQTNPKIIGAFVTGSIVLLVVLVLFFGSFTLFGSSARYVLFFNQSVNGLNVGSAVKYRGVPVGVVERILIRVEGQAEHSPSIPVIIRVDRSRLSNDLGTSVETFGPDSIYDMIDRGLVAQLNVESIITGQLFVEFSMQPSDAGHFQPHRDGEYDMVEIPTLSSSLYEIASDLGRVVSAFAEFDYSRLDQNINEVLEGLIAAMEGLDTKQLSRSFVGAADEMTALLQSGEFEDTLASVRSALSKVETTLTSYNLEDGPLAAEIGKWSQAFERTLDGVDQLVADSSELLAPDSSVRTELENSLRELGRAAQSLRFLADYLERNPNALITGRSESSQ